MTKLYQYCRTAPHMRQGLHDLCHWIKSRADVAVFVEIGSFAGESTAIFAEYFPLVIAVDPFQPGYDDRDQASHRLRSDELQIREAFCKRTTGLAVQLLEMESSTAIGSTALPQHIDAVYIDACHVYESVKRDILMWTPRIARPGIICGHDYREGCRHGQGVIKAVRESFGDPSAQFCDSSWAVVLT